MSKPRRITLSAIAALAFGLVALPGSASATVVVGPSPMTFPEREVNSTSDPQAATVTVVCNSFNPGVNPAQPCLTQDTFTRNPQFSGDNPGDFFAEGGTCPPSITLLTTPVAQCTILIRFKPTAAGQREAMFLAGSSTTGGPNTIVVRGSAVPAPKKLKKCKKKKGKKKKRCKKKKK